MALSNHGMDGVFARRTRNHQSPAAMARRRGYSLLELVVVAVLATSLIALVGRWVGQLGQVALQQATSGIQVSAAIAADRIEDDLTSAVACRGTDAVVRTIDASEIEMAVRKIDGSLAVVHWKVDTATGVLTRAEQPTTDCAPVELPPGAFVLESVATGSPQAPLFEVILEGGQTAGSEAYGTCETRDLPRCRIAAVQLNLTVLDGSTPVVSKKVMPVGV